jgi:hypothetical protein
MTEGNYSNVGHRGPIYKGLGAMNPCDNLKSSAIVLTVTVNRMPQIHPVISPVKAQSQLIDYGRWGFYILKGKRYSNPETGLCGLEGSRRLRLPDF